MSKSDKEVLELLSDGESEEEEVFYIYSPSKEDKTPVLHQPIISEVIGTTRTVTNRKMHIKLDKTIGQSTKYKEKCNES